uniref:Uncharacterized protein n=1 Tax=Anguilla anguilla TaxID=7936 RepID=A0A0E9T1N8_ANGAN
MSSRPLNRWSLQSARINNYEPGQHCILRTTNL